ncbi:MAG TPA: hypothetical protein VJN94_06290 [Candidatus Binataceae bacterium]|nr:hypothetical protein [Candidatus Binataceae bacterium]
MTKWREAAIGFSIDPIEVSGLNVWEEEWRPVDAPEVMLPHPAYPKQIHHYKIYEIGDVCRPVRFAAAELSNQVWGFYVPDKTSE